MRDVIGEAYEASILQVIKDANQRGEFFTPYELSLLMSQIVGPCESVHDPACGSGSLLLTMDARRKHGYEINPVTAEMAAKNVLDADIVTVDTLAHDPPKCRFEAVVSNPPYSTPWNHGEADPFDPRWMGKPLAPKTKSDLAFVLHGVHVFKRIGVFVMFPGALYRSGREAQIRQWLIANNLVDCVIALPEKLFLRTSIGVCLLILKKGREEGAPVLWIDGREEFIAGSKQNVLKIDKILDAVQDRKEVDRFSVLRVPKDDTLTVNAYVDTSTPEPEIDIKELNAHVRKVIESHHNGDDWYLRLINHIEGKDAEWDGFKKDMNDWMAEQQVIKAEGHKIMGKEDEVQKKTLGVKDGFLCNQRFTVLTPKGA